VDSSQFSDNQPRFDALERLDTQGATCDTFRVKLYGKLHFLKRLKSEHAGDIRYQEALRKEFETGYRLEHPNLVRYLSLDKDSILMEYVDGETLSQRLANNPTYFKNRKNTQKFVLQLLDVVGYLHRHQVLHLDLKPDNILLTRINDDVKLIDLGCCYTDAFQDTTGHTNAFAAPEQLAGQAVDVRTDIYAIGRILETLSDHTIYNKVIARCTVSDPIDRYQSVEEIQRTIRRRFLYFHWIAAFVAALALVAVAWSLSSRQQEPAPAIMPETPIDSVAYEKQDTVSRPKDMIQLTTPTPVKTTRPQSSAQQLKTDTDRMMEKAYQSTIATFCDSVFPSPTTVKAWSDASTEFHHQTTQIGNRLVEKYPEIPESTIRQDVESRFQNLVAYVFNKMRGNGQNRQ
jgi:serine/threonine protein kinase